MVGQNSIVTYGSFLPSQLPFKVNPPNQLNTIRPRLFIAKRTADAKYQVIYASENPVFNYWVLCDSADVNNNTSFATSKDATDFLNSPFVSSPANKTFVKFADTAAKDVFVEYNNAPEIYVQNRTPPKPWC
jgi:hypothetical protein